MKSTFKTIFCLKRQTVKTDGTSPIMRRISIAGTQTQFSCKLTVDAKIWDAKTGRATGRSTVALETNRMLGKIRVKINRHYQEIMDRDNYVTAEKVKNAFLGLKHRQYTLLKVLERHNEDYEKLYKAGIKAKSSFEKYLTVYKHLKEFIYQRYHMSDIALRKLTPAFITDFDMFLHVDKHCCNNTVWIYTCPLRTMVAIAINNRWLTRGPFREYEIKKEDTERGFPTREEISLLMNGKLKNAKQELVRDLFIFCCFTNSPQFIGLQAFVDGKLVGCCVGNIEPYYTGDYYYLKEMFVSPEFQKQGIGRCLMGEIKAELHKLGIEPIILFTGKDFFPYDFYLKSGFAEMEEMRMMSFGKTE